MLAAMFVRCWNYFRTRAAAVHTFGTYWRVRLKPELAVISFQKRTGTKQHENFPVAAMPGEELSAYYARGTVTGFAKMIDGKRIWRTEQQVIEESFQLPCGSLFLFITYKPQTKSEL